MFGSKNVLIPIVTALTQALSDYRHRFLIGFPASTLLH